jgi:TrmH family RNA methyltransferase
VALLAGAEGTGLTGPAMVRASRRVTIPMTGRVDSLNVATAVSIALYHAGVSARP